MEVTNFVQTDDFRNALLCFSVGSIGHPYSCKLACKYHGKASGCKDGRFCTRCHLCVWQRRQCKPNIDDVVCFNCDIQSEIPSACGDPSSVTTPVPPTVCKKPGGFDSEGFPSDAETPPQVGEYVAKSSLDIAHELNRKLQWLQQGQHVQQYGVVEMTDGMEKDQHPLQAAQVASSMEPALVAKSFMVDVAPPTPVLAAPPGLMLPFHNYLRKPESSSDVSKAPVISIGSVGHPHNCGKACKYARRKTGCRDGSSCLDCHQCHWHREHVNRKEECLVVGVFSVGTQGHPHSCGNACKYVRRKGGCRNGANCTDCHQCQWRHHPQGGQDETSSKLEGNAAKQMFGAEATAVMPNLWNGGAMPDDTKESCFANSICPSVGSIGHPLFCTGSGCKYNGKAKGCKDGSLCLRCHLCPWRRCHSGEWAYGLRPGNE